MFPDEKRMFEVKCLTDGCQQRGNTIGLIYVHDEGVRYTVNTCCCDECRVGFEHMASQPTISADLKSRSAD